MPGADHTHCYQLDATSLAQAAAAGLGLPKLYEALATLGVALPPALLRQLHEWHARGYALQLAVLPVLRTADASLLSELRQRPALRTVLGEPLAPTTVLLQADRAAAAQQLRAAGYVVSMAPPAPPQRMDAETGALWLAGQLYALLGHHLPLPLPPPFAALEAHWQALSPEQQAALQGQLAQLRNHLLDLVDQLPFTAPPHPTEPAQWQPLLDQALANQGWLEMIYFSPGRNLLTRRLIQPHAYETWGVARCIRAWCAAANAILTFRLDRIHGLTLVAPPVEFPPPPVVDG